MIVIIADCTIGVCPRETYCVFAMIIFLKAPTREERNASRVKMESLFKLYLSMFAILNIGY